MDFYLYLLLTLAYAGLLVFGFRRVRETGIPSYSNLVLLIALGLVYDNAIIMLGRTIGEGGTLYALSTLRFWTHAFFTPALVLVAWDLLHRTGVSWARTPAARTGSWVLTLILVVYQIAFGTLKEVSRLVPEEKAGVLRYASSESAGGPLMVIVTSLVLLGAGIVLFIKRRWIWMALGVGLLFVSQGLPLPFESSALTNIFELVLIVSLWATVRHVDRHGDGAVRSRRQALA
ncbi:hypothetical protein N6H14_08845 [Paenibacillus sp. CC-CFT747]|nr:hypothetical protein N6H14_08845 [Paenibacillus sp. CC-CFT747]